MRPSTPSGGVCLAMVTDGTHRPCPKRPCLLSGVEHGRPFRPRRVSGSFACAYAPAIARRRASLGAGDASEATGEAEWPSRGSVRAKIDRAMTIADVDPAGRPGACPVPSRPLGREPAVTMVRAGQRAACVYGPRTRGRAVANGCGAGGTRGLMPRSGHTSPAARSGRPWRERVDIALRSSSAAADGSGRR